MTEKITRADRDALLSLIRKRERVMKTGAEERSAAMLADFDAQLARAWSWDEDAIWNEAKAVAEAAVGEANEKIAARCRELGIPDEFAPSLAFGWRGQNQQQSAERRELLRRAAKSRIAAVQKDAERQIERLALDAQTDLLSAGGLTSASASAFLDGLKSIDSLMPPVALKEIEQLVEARKNNPRARLGYDDIGGMN